MAISEWQPRYGISLKAHDELCNELTMKKYYILVLALVALSNVTAQKDIENSKDYRFLDRLPEYFIRTYSEVEFDSHEFHYNGKKQNKEGRKFIIEYRQDKWKNKDYEFPTRLQILRNYAYAIEKEGGSILFERYNDEHGFYSFKTSDGKEIWIQVKTAIMGKSHKLIVIDKANMRQDIVIDAELIKNAIALEGKIAIYGIYFDTGKAIIKGRIKTCIDSNSRILAK
ncbi:hypothetical protein [Maribacter aestuarii]|uniref:hypothetical protein n=1 Tax=Maribacter aestuarii TaxID=1130723 RepID=UPI00248D054E|nr:hypothetical protein [Maribacter aestuarii]